MGETFWLKSRGHARQDRKEGEIMKTASRIFLEKLVCPQGQTISRPKPLRGDRLNAKRSKGGRKKIRYSALEHEKERTRNTESILLELITCSGMIPVNTEGTSGLRPRRSACERGPSSNGTQWTKAGGAGANGRKGGRRKG